MRSYGQILISVVDTIVCINTKEESAKILRHHTYFYRLHKFIGRVPSICLNLRHMDVSNESM
jgi:hypothetical protein